MTQHISGSGESLALLYSDGSMGTLRSGISLEEAREERDEFDRNETNPADMTMIARVNISVLEILDDPTGGPIAGNAICPTCGRRKVAK